MKNTFGLSAIDKTPKPFGFNFHHTDPQRYIPCIKGDMLCPRSADDIAPITPEAMASVQAALALLANLIADRDHNLFLCLGHVQQAEMVDKARDIMSTARALTGILRVKESS